MTPEEIATLKDLYEALEPDPEAEKADYVMQTLCRDLSSNCNFVGPYYTSSGLFKAKAMLACVMEAQRKFSCSWVRRLCSDPQRCLIQLDDAEDSARKERTIYHSDEHSDHHEIPISFTSCFTGEKVHIIICPSHQVCIQ